MHTRSTTPMWAAKVGYLLSAAALIALGGRMLFSPQIAAEAFVTLLGILTAVFGAVKLLGYFSKDLYRLAFEQDLHGGILLLLLGGMLLIRPETGVVFFCVVFGCLIVLDGILKLRIAQESRRFGIRSWWLLAAEGALAAVLGALLIFRPFESAAALTVLFGLSLLCEGLLNLSVALTTVKIVKNQLPDEPGDGKGR